MEQLLELPISHDKRSVVFWKSPTRWLLHKNLSRGFWIFFGAAFFFDFGFAVYFFLFNLYLLDCHFDERTMGLVGGALTLGSVAFTLPAGMLARKIGLQRLLVLCFIAAPLMGVVRTMFLRPSAQIALAFFAGVAMSLWGVCFPPAIARLTTEDNRASAFGLIFSVSVGTSALGGVICGYLPQWLHRAGFALDAAEVKRFILLGSCAIALFGLIPLARLRLCALIDENQSGELRDEKGWREVFRVHPFLHRFLPAMALWTAVIASFTPFANVYLSRNLAIPLNRIGTIFAVAQLVQLLVGLATPLVFRGLGLVNGIFATQLATAIVIGLLASAHDQRLAVLWYLTCSATQWMSSPGLYNLLMTRTPDKERSSAAAITLFCNALLQTAATAIAGILFVRFGYPHVLAGIAVLAVLSAILFKFLVGHSNAPAVAVES